MTSIATEVFAAASCNGDSIFFVGAKQEEVEAAASRIKEAFPSLRVLGARSGYFESAAEKEDFVSGLRTLSPDIVVAGMGTPMQEEFLVALANAGWRGKGFTCGGFLHQTAKALKYYPDWINALHLRWAYRIYDEPKLFKRYFLQYPKFLLVFLFDLASRRGRAVGIT